MRKPLGCGLDRVFVIDALRCDDCGDRYARIADMRALGLPDTPVPIVPARPPPDNDAPDPASGRSDDDVWDEPADWEQGELDRAA